jgi:hypothetical protein
MSASDIRVSISPHIAAAHAGSWLILHSRGHRSDDDLIAIESLPDGAVVPLSNIKRYEGEACPNCSEFKMVRIGTQMRCDACSATTGED